MEQNKKIFNYDKKVSHAALGFGCEATYNTSNKNYGQSYLVDQKLSDVPTYSEVVEALQDFKKMEKLIKNKTVASQYSKQQSQEGLDEIEKEKFKFDRNVIVPKIFPVKADQYKYPEPSLNPGSILYKTTNKDYGHKIPTNLEIPTKFFPRDTKYTTSFPDNYKFNGLNTAKTFSKVHKNLDEI